ncbi:PEP/pyruvate-binding domain-containing protein [Streptomyces sp. JJ36]|uniref:PEP/pyruvate-binding domain-containing protein n=1 Tax=Streptomyces sp. JJ36 TaxID=2736645 RepID=UPI001EEDA0D5|nr:PEP/pyruvate-binding domain-containing protein [Streptomyces sp. JJ36]MCF6521789.1 phosphoenolpyruvate-utilizing enzyme [Streptomyces sp. JJ36]
MTVQNDSPAAVDPGGDHIVVLGRDSRARTEHLGGKAARLGEMLAAGLPVPPAFCLTTELFRRFLDDTGLAKEIEEAAGTGFAAIRKEITARPVPEPLARAILGAYEELGRPRVAVRSSASKEDSAAQSFAGQHDTLLDVQGDDAVLDAVKECWASLWSDRAAVYRDDPASVGSIAVVVQEMVHADASGVLFTVDPMNGRPHRMVIESCWGLGEGLVSGKVTSDLFVVDDRDFTLAENRVRYKVTKCAAVEPGRTGMVKVDPELRNAPSLTHDQAIELARLADRVRESYGAEQDIEWVLRDGTFYLLQTRPITTRPSTETHHSPYITKVSDKVRTRTLWSRMDIGEIFVGRMSPLGISFAQYYQQNIHGGCAKAIGMRDHGDMDLHMGYLQGHVYLNVSYTSYMLSQAPATKDQSVFTERFASEEVDLGEYRNPFGQWPGGVNGFLSATHWLRDTVVEMATMKKRAKKMASSRLAEFDRAKRIDLKTLGRRELNGEFQRYLRYCYAMNVGYMPYYINAFGFYDVLSELCGKWLGDEGTNLQNHIKTDMSNLRTVESARDMWDLAQAAKKDPEVLRIIRETPLGDITAALQASSAGRSYLSRHLDPFMRVNGTRGRQEMELTHPRWIDDPSYVFQMIRRYVADDAVSPDATLQQSRGFTEQDSAAVLRKLPGSRRAVLKKVIGLYSKCSELREITRMAMITSVWLVRNVVYEVGRRLVEEGVLRDLDEVAYLDFEDVRTYLAGDAPAPQVFSRAKLDERRRTYEYHNRLPEPPLTFMGEYDITRALQPVAGGTRLEALGASPGQVVGRARIIEDLAWQADEFQPGEVLIARYTDASWTPLFAIAGGVVTDIGSMLSHSSIVSREFGIPSVVNTKHATQKINTGDMIKVDGDAGTVEVVEG